MSNYFANIKSYLSELELPITLENEAEGIIIINKESEGFKNLILGVLDPILIIEQFLIEIPNVSSDILQQILIKNRDIVHGAFVLDENGKKLIFRNTHQLRNLDLNELESTLNSLSLLLSEYSEKLIQFSKK
jgi:hypothetical protein